MDDQTYQPVTQQEINLCLSALSHGDLHHILTDAVRSDLEPSNPSWSL